ncbi:hypothetical protein AB205_0210150 [Aquarana catesbeiana]|uniref:Uncharacterized protein n=1 Tax=Aquarana catesbeiana TaxID=8400 RepID=A0A2G9Q8B5_AQUCT|nr:hypothetical protein AB205_0210150 [Aquarana catesbeiana]
MVQSDVGVPIADCLQVLGCDTPNSTPLFLSVQVSERTEGIVGLEIPADEEQEEVRLPTNCMAGRHMSGQACGAQAGDVLATQDTLETYVANSSGGI